MKAKQSRLFDDESAPLKAITVHGLWAWAIVYGPKRWENRSWPTKYRGRLAIHCGVSRKSDAHARAFLESQGVACPSEAELEALRGKVIGICELVSCETPEGAGGDPYAFGPHCFGLEDRRALASPVPCKGKLSLWSLPPGVEQSVRRQLQSAA